MKIKTGFILLLFVPLFVFAQNQAILPNAGLTPESPFYFIDKLGEALREFFTFNPEGKARLQITFAAERIAEIKVILETKGVEAKGLKVAQVRLKEHLGNAVEIIIKQKGKGKDISKLAKEFNDQLEIPKSALADIFKVEKRALEAKEDILKAQLKSAHRAGDTAKEKTLDQELGQVKAQKELFELKEEDIEDELGAEEERIEEEMEVQLKAKKAIREAEEEKQEIINEVTEEGTQLPANAFANFDSLLVQAKSVLAAENFVEAKNLAKRAEKSLDQIEEIIEELEKKQEEKEEADEVIKEAAEEEKQEVLNEARKEVVEVPVKPTPSPAQSMQPPKQSVLPTAKDTGGYSFEIKGYVHDVTDAPAMTNGTPVVGIVLVATGPKTLTTQTRADGSYTLSFTGAPLGTYNVCVTLPPGYTMNPPSGCESVIVRPSEQYVKTLELINNGNLALHWTAILFHILRQ